MGTRKQKEFDSDGLSFSTSQRNKVKLPILSFDCWEVTSLVPRPRSLVPRPRPGNEATRPGNEARWLRSCIKTEHEAFQQHPKFVVPTRPLLSLNNGLGI